MAGLGMTESFAEITVDVIRKFIPVSKTKNDSGKLNSVVSKECKDAIRVKHRKWKKV